MATYVQVSHEATLFFKSYAVADFKNFHPDNTKLTAAVAKTLKAAYPTCTVVVVHFD